MQQHLSFWTKSWPWFLQNLVLLSGRGVKTRGLAQKIEAFFCASAGSLQAPYKLYLSCLSLCTAPQPRSIPQSSLMSIFSVPKAPEDPILGLVSRFKADPAEKKAGL